MGQRTHGIFPPPTQVEKPLKWTKQDAGAAKPHSKASQQSLTAKPHNKASQQSLTAKPHCNVHCSCVQGAGSGGQCILHYRNAVPYNTGMCSTLHTVSQGKGFDSKGKPHLKRTDSETQSHRARHTQRIRRIIYS